MGRSLSWSHSLSCKADNGCSEGYTPNQPPQFMLKDLMAKTAQLEQFDEELYKVTEFSPGQESLT
jgi:seryl-tRNA synthetase